MEEIKQELNKIIEEQKESIRNVMIVIQNKESEDKAKQRKQHYLNMCKNYRRDHG